MVGVSSHLILTFLCPLGTTSASLLLSSIIIMLLLLFSPSVVSDSLWPQGLQHARPPCPSPSPRACSNSCPLSWWCHPTISSSVIPFFSCPQSFPASGFCFFVFFLHYLPTQGQWLIYISASGLAVSLLWWTETHAVLPSWPLSHLLQQPLDFWPLFAQLED